VQIFINGIILGLSISLLALAYLTVFLPTRIFHVALGGVYVIVPYVAWTLGRAGLPITVAIALSIITGILVSLSCELLNHSWLEKRSATSGAHFISSLGIYIFLVQFVVLTWGNETQYLRQSTGESLRFATISVSPSQLIVFIVSSVVLVGFCCWLKFSDLGLQFRAMADNSKEFGLQGHSTSKLRFLAFGLSGFIGAIAALLIAYDVGFDSRSGLSSLLMAVVAVIIGGQQSFIGAVLGGVVLGLVKSGTVWFLSAQWQEASTFLVLVLILLVRPSGLLGHSVRVEVER
jgi:branched-chain amino acid transport system permease protein